MKFLRALAVAATVVWSAGAYATTIEVDAIVYEAGPTNPFGLMVDDVITLTLTYDETMITGSGSEFLSQVPPPGGINSFSLDFGGGLVFTDTYAAVGGTDDETFAYFLDGEFDGFDFLLEGPGWLAGSSDPGYGFELFADQNPPTADGLASAYWDLDSVRVVPVPAAVWLFGSALLGLGAVARRRKIA